MRMGYNQGAGSRNLELMEFITENYLPILKNYKIRDKYFRGFEAFCFFLSIELEKTFYALFPKQKLLKNFISKSIRYSCEGENKSILFDLGNGTHAVWQSYNKKIIKHNFYHSKYSQKKY